LRCEKKAKEGKKTMVRLAATHNFRVALAEREPEDPQPPKPVTIAIGMPTSDSERAALATSLGGGCRVVDIRDAPPDTAILVVPPCSAHAIASLMDTYPIARVLVLEGPCPPRCGPVTTLIRAGAFGYAVSETEPGDLAESINWARNAAA
jgi:hypothetical protein